MASFHVTSEIDKFHGTEILEMNNELMITDGGVWDSHTSYFNLTAFRSSKNPIEFIHIDLNFERNNRISNLGGGCIEFLLDDKTIIEVYSNGESNRYSQTYITGSVQGIVDSDGCGYLTKNNSYKSESIHASTKNFEQTGYIISTEDFKKICDSKYIAIRLHENKGGYIAEHSEDKCEKLLSFFRVFYRDAINNNCYKEESVSQLTKAGYMKIGLIILLVFLTVIILIVYVTTHELYM